MPRNRPSQEGVRVEAVLRSNERDLAIVNGKIVRAGDPSAACRSKRSSSTASATCATDKSHVAQAAAASIPVRR